MKAKPCPECKIWREVVAMLIERMPSDLKSLVCAQLATIPEINKRLSPQQRAQAAFTRNLNRLLSTKGKS